MQIINFLIIIKWRQMKIILTIWRLAIAQIPYVWDIYSAAIVDCGNGCWVNNVDNIYRHSLSADDCNLQFPNGDYWQETAIEYVYRLKFNHWTGYWLNYWTIYWHSKRYMKWYVYWTRYFYAFNERCIDLYAMLLIYLWCCWFLCWLIYWTGLKVNKSDSTRL